MSMLVSIMAAIPVRAATSGSCGDNLTWTYNTANRELTISGTGAMDDFEIYTDEQYGDRISTVPWAEYMGSIMSVVIEEGVTTIGNIAFGGASSLETLVLPDGLISIGSGAFASCKALTEITIPEGVKKIGETAFVYCTELERLSIPDSIESVGYSAFNNTPKLAFNEYNGAYYLGNENNPYLVLYKMFDYEAEELVIYDGTKIVCNNVLNKYCKTTSLTIPASVIEVGAKAFQCKTLTDISFGGIPSGIGGAYDRQSDAIYGQYLKHVTFLEGVTDIPDYFFGGGGSVTFAVESINLPSTIKNIGECAFRYCQLLETVNVADIDSFVTATFGNRVFWDCYNLYLNGELVTDVTIPDGAKEIGPNTFRGNKGLKSVTVPERVTSIGEYAFYDCLSLETIDIPDSVTSIGERAFASCPSLTALEIGDGVRSIGKEAFAWDTSFKSVTLGSSVATIGEGAFASDTALTDVTFKGTPLVGKNAFDKCDALTDVYVYGSADNWMDIKANAEEGNNALKLATVHYIDNAPALVVESADKVVAGDTFTVSVSAQNNPGFSSFTIGVGYDDAKFTLESVEPSADLGGNFIYTQKAVWVNSGDYKGDGVIFTMTFKAHDDAEPGESFITLTYGDGDVSNFNEEDVEFKIVPGKVNVVEFVHTPGDVNGDNAVNSKDLTRLVKVLAGDDVTCVAEALDVNGDGETNVKDLVRLMKYLSGDAVEIY